MKIAYSSRANREVRRILEYYKREAGAEMAFRFHSELRAVTDKIKQWPVISADRCRDSSSILANFPFQVVYRVEPKNRIRILAVRHHAQNPDLGLDR